MTHFYSISPEKALEILNENQVTVFDARDLPSYRQGAVQGAIFLTEDRVAMWAQKLDEKLPILIYCFYGNTSKILAGKFVEYQFERVYSIEGGYRPLADLLEKKTMQLESKK